MKKYKEKIPEEIALTFLKGFVTAQLGRRSRGGGLPVVIIMPFETI